MGQKKRTTPPSSGPRISLPSSSKHILSPPPSISCLGLHHYTSYTMSAQPISPIRVAPLSSGCSSSTWCSQAIFCSPPTASCLVLHNSTSKRITLNQYLSKAILLNRYLPRSISADSHRIGQHRRMLVMGAIVMVVNEGVVGWNASVSNATILPPPMPLNDSVHHLSSLAAVFSPNDTRNFSSAPDPSTTHTPPSQTDQQQLHLILDLQAPEAPPTQTRTFRGQQIAIVIIGFFLLAAVLAALGVVLRHTHTRRLKSLPPPTNTRQPLLRPPAPLSIRAPSTRRDAPLLSAWQPHHRGG